MANYASLPMFLAGIFDSVSGTASHLFVFSSKGHPKPIMHLRSVFPLRLTRIPITRLSYRIAMKLLLRGNHVSPDTVLPRRSFAGTVRVSTSVNVEQLLADLKGE